MEAYAPNGKRILGTLEIIYGRAEIQEDSFAKKRDGVDFEWEGGTEVFWDGQMTVTKKKRRVFLDEDGNEWTENQIKLREAK